MRVERLLLVLSLTVASGCDVYESKLVSPVSTADAGTPSDSGMVDAEPPDAMRDAPVFDPDTCTGGDCWWSIDPADGCKSAGLPGEGDRPDPDGDGTTDIGAIYVGFSKLRIGSTNLAGEATDDAWQGFGLDLDGACTNSATCPGATQVSCMASTMTVPFDGQLCRDNTFARLQPVVAQVPEIGETFGLSESVFNCSLWRGTYNDIVRVSGYNGLANDSRVRLDFYRSTGLEETSPFTCEDEPEAYTKYPRWRSSQAWRVIDADLSEPMTATGSWPDSKLVDANAYVKNGYLVARMPDDAAQGFISDEAAHRGFQFKVQQGYYIGRIYKVQDGTWAIKDGLAAGRIRKQDLVQAFRQVGFCDEGKFGSFYTSMLSYVDENADVLASGQNDPKQACDAMSYALGFEAAQITPGMSVPEPKRFECCAPGKTEAECSSVCGDAMVSGDEACDTAIAAGKPGACPTTCPRLDSCTPQAPMGSGCDVVCAAAKITAIGPKDGCCPAGANALSDGDCSPVCGNGAVEGSETCDPPGSCQACTTSNPCLPKHQVGSAASCDLRCESTEITQCQNGDGCCPLSCSDANDRDCSAMCGNGRLDSGETCETSGSATRCPTSCDDGKACTRDVMTGSTNNCNVVCENTPITQVMNGDGCCPDMASANNDNDCAANCGNKIIETGEQCDDGNENSGDGCVNCQTESPAQSCLARLGTSDACAQCSCNKCTSQTTDCQGASNADEAKLCKDMVDCGRRTGCRDPDCICGSANLLICLAGGGDGPCKNEVIAAAKTPSPADIQLRAMDPAYPLGRANLLGSCVDTNCKTECGL